MDELTDAEDHLNEAQQAFGGDGHGDLASVEAARGRLCHFRGDNKKARKHFQKAIKMQEPLFGR